MAVEALTCRELVELVTEYLENSMPAAEQARLEAHLAGCQGCRNYLDQMRRTIQLSGRLTEESVPEEGRDRLLEAFRNWKKGSNP